MSNLALCVERMGKRYRIGQRMRYLALRDVAAGVLSTPFRWLRDGRRMRDKASLGAMGVNQDDYIWALKDVSFEVKHGNIVGIVGRNGAGKSTLLKILSRITKPTEGRAEIYGRVGSLLEVGTGFHPELTGRENIYLNGAILGMTKQELQRKFDAIVAFAEVERFIDTPVKHYSTGMHLRLAFAIAAHLEPDILVVDEVLAVGDAEFQKKCLGTMQEVSKRGKTILFVSHQMAALQNLCDTGILLSQGRIVQMGPISDVIKHYLTQSHHLAELPFEDRVDRQGSGVLRFTRASLRDGGGKEVTAFACGSPAVLELSISNTSGRSLRNVRIAVGVDTEAGQRIVVFSSHLVDQDFPQLPVDVVSVELRIPRMTLTAGRYGFSLFASVNGEVADWITNAGTLDVEAGDFYGTGQMPLQGQGWGSFMMDHKFSLGQRTEPWRE